MVSMTIEENQGTDEDNYQLIFLNILMFSRHMTPSSFAFESSQLSPRSVTLSQENILKFLHILR